MKERGLFAGMALLLLVPLWSVACLPATDGPSHVYNARSWPRRMERQLRQHPKPIAEEGSGHVYRRKGRVAASGAVNVRE